MDEPRVFGGEPSEDMLALGYAWGTDEKGELWQLKAVAQEDRLLHFHVIGASGTGKTKFLEYLIGQDIKNGFGFGVIDPHGDLIRDVKEWLALEDGDRGEHVVLVDPTDKKRTVAFNPLELADGTDAARQAQELVVAFKKIYEDSWGQRLEGILRNTLIALIENRLTLLELPLFLRDAAVRAKLLRNVKSETCRDFFENDFEKWSERTRPEWTQSTLNKVDAFLSDSRMRQMFAPAKSSFSFRDIMDGRKILLVNLSKGILGEESSKLLGSLLLAKIQMAAMQRAEVKEDERVPFYLYIDEFQNFAEESFMRMLDETRKYRLALTLAHQHLEQVSFKLRPSLMNCGLQACFRVAPADAEVLARGLFAGLYANINEREQYVQLLQSLEPRACFVRNNARGGIIQISVPPPFKGPERAGREADDDRIGSRYLRRREDIDKEYRERRRTLVGGEDEENFYDSF